MNLQKFIANENEKPLDNITENGGFTGIFRTICCIGDSLSSGEFESLNPDGSRKYTDMFEYSWGQYIARMCGSKVYNFSRGGMTASEYCQNFATEKGFWNKEYASQCYIIALGVNDVLNQGQEIGDLSSFDVEDYHNNKTDFAGYYAQIISRMKEISPDPKFVLMTMTQDKGPQEREQRKKAHRELLYKMADTFTNTYVLDFNEYAPVYDESFKNNFYLYGHLNPMGYILTAKMTASYIDYIIRHNPDDFKQVGFIGLEEVRDWRD